MLILKSLLAGELDQEIRSHLEMLIDENIRAGMPPKEAQRAARIALGGGEQVKELVRERRVGNWLHSVVSDCRYGVRQLRKNPGFTAVAVVTLAMAIGANAVVFSVMNALILHPLNVPQAESLYQLMRGKDKAGNHSFPDYLDLRDRNRTFDELVAFDGAVAGIDTGRNPSTAWGALVTGNYFDGLHLQPYLCRFFHPAYYHGPHSTPYICLTHAYRP